MVPGLYLYSDDATKLFVLIERHTANASLPMMIRKPVFCLVLVRVRTEFVVLGGGADGDSYRRRVYTFLAPLRCCKGKSSPPPPMTFLHMRTAAWDTFCPSNRMTSFSCTFRFGMGWDAMVSETRYFLVGMHITASEIMRGVA